MFAARAADRGWPWRDRWWLAAAFGLGVFIAFFPLLGIHTGMALVIAILLRLNRVAILVGCWINNPWTIAPMYSAGTLLGCALLGVAPGSPVAIDWSLKGRAGRSPW